MPTIAKIVGQRKKRGWVADHKESAVEYAAKETMKQYWAMRAEQRVVDSSVVDCTKVDCAWYDPKRERNCFRDPGDCRYIV